MTSFEDVDSQFLSELVSHEFHTDEATQLIKNYRVFKECQPEKEPEPLPEPVPEPQPNWFERHSDALIKSGFAFLGVLAIVAGEKLGNHIYNTKAWSSIPR